MSSQERTRIPVSASYIPFIPSPEFLRKRETENPPEEYVPEPVTKSKQSRTKYGYVPTPINKPSEEEILEQQEKSSQKPRGNVATQKRKIRRLRQRQKPQSERKRYVFPTSSIAVGDPYWFPVFWQSKKPDNSAEFKKTFVTLVDKQRVVVKTYANGKITVWRAGEEITLRKANSFGIGTGF